jgi:predicted ATPase with chaperone activity
LLDRIDLQVEVTRPGFQTRNSTAPGSDITAEQMDLSPRACQRVLKVARTLADLENLDNIGMRHLAEALAYRGFDCGKSQG